MNKDIPKYYSTDSKMNPSSIGLQKVSVMPLECGLAPVIAQYNPREIGFDKTVDWQDNTDGPGTNYPKLYFTSGKAISVTVEFFFDHLESGSDVRNDVNKVLKMCEVQPSLKRPVMVQLLWDGNPITKTGTFTGVITSASVKYTMFSGAIPVRATVSVSIKQADTVVVADKGSGMDTESSIQNLRGVTVQEVSNNDALKSAITEAGGDPANKATWPDSVIMSVSSKSRGKKEEQAAEE